MIFLTGDVHHRSMNSLGQTALKPGQTEIKLAYRYLEIALKYNVKVTLFITGRAFLEEWETIQPLLNFENLEVGGHTFNAHQPNWHYRFECFTQGSLGYRFSTLRRVYLKLLYRNHIFSKWYQKKEIEKTLEIIEDRCNRKVLSWRDHGYRHNRLTYRILADKGVKVVSNDVTPRKVIPQYICDKLISLPINVIPDHEHVYHGRRTKKFVDKYPWRGDAFSNESYSIESWAALALEQTQNIVSQGAIATLLIHPACMFLADGFQTFEYICKCLSNYSSHFCSEIPDEMKRRRIGASDVLWRNNLKQSYRPKVK